MIEQIETKKVVTRKAHNCFACNRKFDSGTEMESQVVVCDGYIYRLYTCSTCQELINKFSSLFEEDGSFPSSCVYEVLRYDSETGNVETPEELLRELNVTGITSEF